MEMKSNNRRYCIGKFAKNIIDCLGLDIEEDTPIYISDNNILHIREFHSDAYMKYYEYIGDIIKNPDYIGIAGVKQKSVEYVKRFYVNDEYVNVAVRATNKGTYFVRSMFIIEEGKLNRYLSNSIDTESYLIPVDNNE